MMVTKCYTFPAESHLKYLKTAATNQPAAYFLYDAQRFGPNDFFLLIFVYICTAPDFALVKWAIFEMLLILDKKLCFPRCPFKWSGEVEEFIVLEL